MSFTLPTILSGNLPPSGRGVYANGSSAYDVGFLSRFDFVAINARRGDAVTLARELVGRGVDVWFYDYGSGWEPGDDHATTVARYEALCDSTGAIGGIVDAEGGWHASSDTTSLAAAIGASISRGHRWGITSFPEGLAWCQALAKVGAWGSPQMYGQTNAVPAWYERWEAIFGARMVVPSVALWPGTVNGIPGNDWARDANVYAAYLRSIPQALGAIGWTAGIPSDAMLAAFLDWAPWGNVLSRVLYYVRARALTPVGIALLAILAFFVAFIVARL